jgi:hypothetical protein
METALKSGPRAREQFGFGGRRNEGHLQRRSKRSYRTALHRRRCQPTALFSWFMAEHDARDQLELVFRRLGLEPFVHQVTGGGDTLIEATGKIIGESAKSSFGIVLVAQPTALRKLTACSFRASCGEPLQSVESVPHCGPDTPHPRSRPSASRTSGPRRRSRALHRRSRSRGHHSPRLVCSMGSRSTHRHHNWRPTMRSSDRAGCRVLWAECRS